MLPNFIGIGAPRCGSTWLHGLLQSHPDIYMPGRRKELYFFNKHYERGLDWYETFFPGGEDGRGWRAVGEITPVYMYDPVVPGRLGQFESVDRLVAILRHPVDRAKSHYRQAKMLGQTELGFRDFITDNPMRIRLGNYSEFILPFLDHFDRSQILILIFEDSVAEVEKTKKTLAAFLGVDASRFPDQAGLARSNAGVAPAHGRVYRAAHGVASQLRSYDLDWVVNLGHKLGLKRSMVGTGRRSVPLSPEDSDWLTEHYTPEFDALESRLGVDVSTWRNGLRRER